MPPPVHVPYRLVSHVKVNQADTGTARLMHKILTRNPIALGVHPRELLDE